MEAWVQHTYVKRFPERLITVSTFIAGIFVCLTAGTLYAATVFADPLRDLLHFKNKAEMNAAISVGDIGLYLGFISGFLNDKMGPAFTLLVSGIAIWFGYFMVWGAARGWFHTPWWLLSIFLFFVGQGSFGGFSAAYATSAYNIDKRFRGTVIGLMVAAFATSSAMFSQIYAHAMRTDAFGNNIQSYLLMVSVGCGSVMVAGAFFICKRPTRSSEEYSYRDSKEELIVHDEIQNPEENDGVKGFRMVFHLNFWLLFGVMFFGTGSGLMWINNQNGLAASLNKHGITTTLVLILAGGSVAGRLILGVLSDLMQYRMSRAWWLTVASLLMAATHISFAFVSDAMLLPATFFTGAAYGGLFALTLTLVANEFGHKYMGTNNGIMSMAPAIAGLIYNQIFSAVFDGFAHTSIVQEPTSGMYAPTSITLVCFGVDCFQNSFFVTTGTLLAGTALSVWLALRIPKSYKKEEQI